MITMKYKKETASALAHTNVYQDDTYLGYIIRNHSPYAVVGENWNFASAIPKKIPYFYGRTKLEVIKRIKSELEGENIITKSN